MLDIDETSLSNYDAIRRQLHLRPLAGRGAARRRPPPGSYLAERRGGVLHHRPREHAGPHGEQPQREGYDGWQHVLKPTPRPTPPSVQERRRAIEGQGYRIIANVGDQYSDLAGGHEDIGFKLANPFYFLP